ncbi:MAG: hypothetical protein K6B15_04595 [Parasporobacterium sp.]|nr:hypothetical protein [Parasporobacterium sp.]
MNNSRDITIFELKNIGKSIWFLLFTICTSALCVFSFVMFFSSLYGGLFINYLASVVFYTIQAIGLWLIYAQSMSKGNAFSTTGITMFKVIENIKYVILIIVACLFLFLGILFLIVISIDSDAYISTDIQDVVTYITYSVPGMSSLYTVLGTSGLGAVSVYAFTMVISIAFIVAGGIILAIALIYYPKLLRTLISMRSSAKFGVPFTYTSTAVFVMLIIYAIFLAITAFSNIGQLSMMFGMYYVSPIMILSLITPFIGIAQVIFALFILRHYKGAMLNVDAYLTQNNMYPNGVNPNVNPGFFRGYQQGYSNPYVNNNQFNGYNQQNQGYNQGYGQQQNFNGYGGQQNFNGGFNQQQQNYGQTYNNQANQFNNGFNPQQDQQQNFNQAPQNDNFASNPEQADQSVTNTSASNDSVTDNNDTNNGAEN